MEFEVVYTQEQEIFRAEVSAWLDEHVAPDLARRTRTPEEASQKYRERRRLGRDLGKRGWLYPSAPAQYGGGGMDSGQALVLREEFHKRGLGLPPYYDSGGWLGGATIQVWGSDEQKAELLPPIYRGEVRTWQLLSEPDAGSDLANVRMSAVRDGDDYLLTGQKVYIGSGNGADRHWVLAMTARREDRHHNLSWFMVDADSEGIEVQPQFLMSNHGEGEGDLGHKNTIYYANVRVPASRLIGGENNGWKVAGTHLDLEHGAMASAHEDRFLGRLLDLYLEMGEQGFVADGASVLDILADLHVDSELNRLLGLRNFWMAGSGQKIGYEAPQAMYLKKTSGLWRTRAVADLLGPYALTDDEMWGALDGFAEEQQRDGIVDMHPGATGEIHKMIIARHLGIGRAS